MDGDNVVLIEKNAAAQSLKNGWTRLASTYGCMMVALTDKTLTIKPHWFASWLIGPLHLDLRHEIPLASIQGVNEIGEWHSYGKVEVQFQPQKDKDQKILLYLKKSGEFVDKLSRAIQQ